jgi:opacity protein-like surface antigen
MKMKAYCQLLASLVLAATASGVQAQSAASATYVEAGFDATRISADEFESFPTTGRLTLGHNLHPNLAIESTLIFTASEAVEGKDPKSKNKADEITFGVSGAALYLKPKMALSKDTEVFARLGYSSVRYSATINKSIVKDDPMGSFSYGVGVQTNITNKLYAQGSFTLLSKTKDTMAESVGVTLGYRF